MPRKTTTPSKSSSKSAVKRSPAIAVQKTKKPAIPATIQIDTNPLAADIQPAAQTPTAAPLPTVAPAPAAEISAPAQQSIAAAVPAAVEPVIAKTADTSAPASSLIADLQNGDADIARDAATKLGKLADVSAVEPLITALINTDGFYHAVVRAAAAESLGQLNDRTAVIPLMNAIADEIAEVSLEAIRALAALGDPRATSALQNITNDWTGYYAPIVHRAAEIALTQLAGR